MTLFKLHIFVITCFVTLLLGVRTARAQSLDGGALQADAKAESNDAASPDTNASFEAAKDHFLRGVAHTDRSEWDAALVEFVKSREIFPTTKSTYNAALCLRQLGRFDEALEMYEALLREFPNLEQTERETAERELAGLRTSVGAIELRGGEPGARVGIDGRDRGVLPLTGALRVPAGTRMVRVSREGFLPFEARVAVTGMQTTQVQVELVALAAGGRLRVAEQSGRSVGIVLDGATVGTTPWTGVVPPGEHTIFLANAGDRLGTQPVRVNVALDQTVALNLLAEELEATVTVSATPTNARVSIDGIRIPAGIGALRLRTGTHTVSAELEGWLPTSREVRLERDLPMTVDVVLERDPSTIQDVRRPSIFVQLGAAAPLALVFGGDVSASCSGRCEHPVAIGVQGLLRGIYQWPTGLGLGVDFGYLALFRKHFSRSESFAPVGGLPSDQAIVDDALRLTGFTAGAAAHYRHGDRWPISASIGGGLFFGSMRDHRLGEIEPTTGSRVTVELTREPAARYLYVSPEFRVGRQLGSAFEVSAGISVFVLGALTEPKWDDGSTVFSGKGTARGDGLGTFGNDTLLGSVVILVSPGLAARAKF